MSIMKIPEELKKKYVDDIPGKLEFYFHLLNTTLEKTNLQLGQENKKDFHTYRDEKDEYPDEFKDAFELFEENLRELQEKITDELLEGIYRRD